MPTNKRMNFAVVGLAISIAFSAYHIAFGVITRSWWLFTVGIYYVILSTVRLAVMYTKKSDRFILQFTGIMLMILSLPLAGIVLLAFLRDRGTVFHEILMISLAVYAFSKITLAAVKWIKARRSASARRITLRNISFAAAFVSIFSLQRSMLVSFEGMTEMEIRIMNVATGSAVCIIVFLLGLNLVKKSLRTTDDEANTDGGIV